MSVLLFWSGIFMVVISMMILLVVVYKGYKLKFIVEKERKKLEIQRLIAQNFAAVGLATFGLMFVFLSGQI